MDSMYFLLQHKIVTPTKYICKLDIDRLEKKLTAFHAMETFLEMNKYIQYRYISYISILINLSYIQEAPYTLLLSRYE